MQFSNLGKTTTSRRELVTLPEWARGHKASGNLISMLVWLFIKGMIIIIKGLSSGHVRLACDVQRRTGHLTWF